MQLIEDPIIFRSLAEAAIKQFGYQPEHNLAWFEYYPEDNQTAVYVAWPDDTGMFSQYVEDEWHVFVEPLCPPADAAAKIVEFAEHIFAERGANDLIIDVGIAVKQEIAEILPASFKLTPDDYVLTWPVMDMTTFDPALPGSHFKSIRNVKSKILRDHLITVIPAAEADKTELHRIADDWLAKRTGADEGFAASYHKIIDADFHGMTSARVLLADGRPVGFNAGWEIPNSKNYYYAIGLHDYSIRDFGIFLYLENLEWIKQAGYPEAEMGGVEEGNPLFFKNRFLPARWYQTVSFSIVKNQ